MAAAKRSAGLKVAANRRLSRAKEAANRRLSRAKVATKIEETKNARKAATGPTANAPTKVARWQNEGGPQPPSSADKAAFSDTN